MVRALVVNRRSRPTLNFTFHNPTRTLFGQGRIADLATEIPAGARVLVTYGGGSVIRTGTLDEVRQVLTGFSCCEFGAEAVQPLLDKLAHHGMTALGEHGDVGLELSRQVYELAL